VRMIRTSSSHYHGFKADEKKASEELPKNAKKRKGFFAMIKEYGVFFAVWNTTLWGVAVVTCYVPIYLFVAPEQFVDAITAVGLDQYVDKALVREYGPFGAALILAEVAEIFIFPFSVATTPRAKAAWLPRTTCSSG